MAAMESLQRSETLPIIEPMRRFSFMSQKMKRGTSWRDESAATSTTGTNSTLESASNSSRPSVSESGRRRSSLASFSSILKKSKRQTLAISEDDDPVHAKRADGKIQPSQNRQSLSRGSSLGERFLDLPAEIQTIILAHLSIAELLSFRTISKSCLAIFHANSFTITRNALRPFLSTNDDEYDAKEDECLADVLLQLYPSTFSSTTTDTYFLRTIRRKSLIERQLRVLLTFIQTRVYMFKLTRDLECEHFAPYRPGLHDRLYRPLAHTLHLFETIRHLIVRSHPHHPSADVTIDLCPACTSSLKSVVSSYPSEYIVPIYQIIQLLLQHFRTATRSPSSVTALERKLRGWGYGPPPEEHMSYLVLLGGIPELSKIDEMQGSYSKRLSIVKSYADRVSEAVRINSIAFPDIYKSRPDPVMSSSSSPRLTLAGKERHDVRTALEAVADEQTCMKSLDINLALLTDGILQSAPNLETFFVGPNTLLGKRIVKEGLVEHERDLLSPYGFVTKLMMESYEPLEARMGMREPRGDVSGFVHDLGALTTGHSHGHGHGHGFSDGGGGDGGGGGGGGS